MLVGICQIELYIPAAQSLKDKRGVIKSIKERIANKFNVSIAEINHLDKWQRCSLGIAVIGSEMAAIDRTFNFIDNFLSQDIRVQIIKWEQRVV